MSKTTNKKIKNILIAGGVIATALILRICVVEVHEVSFNDMLPTLLKGDYVLVNKLAYGMRLPFAASNFTQWSRPKRGDVIVFKTPFNKNMLSIRRVMALPGDTILFKNNRFYLNGRQLKITKPGPRKKDFSWITDEDFSPGGLTADKSFYTHLEENLPPRHSHSILIKKHLKRFLNFGPYRVPQGYYFVLGDHRNHAQDSRTWPAPFKNPPQNLAKKEHILGRISQVLLSCAYPFNIFPFVCRPGFIRRHRMFYRL